MSLLIKKYYRGREWIKINERERGGREIEKKNLKSIREGERVFCLNN